MSVVVDGAEQDGARSVVGTLRTPGRLRTRRPAGDAVRAARAFAADVALPLAARTGADLGAGAQQDARRVAGLPHGVLPSGRGVAPEQPAMPQTGALAAYAALLARKVKPPRDVPVRGLPLVVRRPVHGEGVRLPGGIVATLAPEDAKVPPNAARAPRRVQRPAGQQPAPAAAPQPVPAGRGTAPRRSVPRPVPTQARRQPGAPTR
jgi:hypothetical protein